MSRTIFSTVRAPHEPAFTVGSLAITHTGRPSIRPTPVTTPSAGRSPASALASSAVLDERVLVEQQREPVADEQLVLAARASRLPWRGCPAAPGRRAREIVGRSSVTRRSRSGRVRGPACSSALGSSRPTISCASRAHVEQRVEIDAGLDPHVVEHVHEILGDRVARRAGRVRAAAEPADRRVEARHAPLERRRRRSRARCRACCGSAGRSGRR